MSRVFHGKCVTCKWARFVEEGQPSCAPEGSPLPLCADCEAWGRAQLELANTADGLQSTDTVNHPAHYTSGGIEVIDAIEAWGLGFALGNAVKYIARAGKKDRDKTAEDLKKARWYLDREIARVEAK